MKRFFIIGLLSIIMLSCTTITNNTKHDPDKTIRVSTDNMDMNAIIDEARKTIAIFLEKMNNPNANESNFQVKYPFKTDEGSANANEHIWLGDITLEDGKYYGIINNDPESIRSLKYGMKIEFDINMISDWMYIKNGKIIGGKSIKFLIENVPLNQRTTEMNDILKMFE